MKLYEIDQNIEELIESAIDRDTGEIIDPQIEEKLSLLFASKERKCLDISCLIKSWEAHADAHDREACIQKRKSLVLRKKAQRLRDYLSQYLSKDESYEDSRAALKWIKCPRSVVIDIEVEKLPEQYQRTSTKIEADKEKLKKDLINNLEITGVHLAQQQKLTIK